MARTKEIIPAWDTVEILQHTDFELKVQEYLAAKKAADEADAVKKALGQDLQALMTLCDKTKVKYGDYVCSVRGGGEGASVSAKLLASKGVPIKTITECTVPGKTWVYFEARHINSTAKGKVGDGDEGRD